MGALLIYGKRFLPKGFLAKNILLFFAFSGLMVGAITATNFFLFDQNAAAREHKILDTYEKEFNQEMNSKMTEFFSGIVFLSKTSYPFVALDFNIEDQFYNISKGFISPKISVALANRHLSIIKNPLDKMPKELFEKTFTPNRLKTIAFSSNYVYFVVPLKKKSQTPEGYLIGLTKITNLIPFLKKTFLGSGPLTHHLSYRAHFRVNHKKNKMELKTYRVTHSALISKGKIKIIVYILFCFAFGFLIFSLIIRRGMTAMISQLKSAVDFVSKGERSDQYRSTRPDDPLFKGIVDSLLSMNDERLESEKYRKEKEISERVKRVASQVSHDIRSPLTALEMAVSELPNISEENRLIIRNSLEGVKDITNNLVDIQNGDHQELDSKAPILLSGVIESVVSERRFQLRAHADITLNCHIDKNCYRLFSNINRSQFRRIVSNLINNSFEALKNGNKITISLHKSIHQAIIKIEDNGKGIPQNQLKEIFKRGFSFEKPEGSGLGLAHAKEYISSWKGKIKIDSEVGFGTTVTLTLPVAEDPAWFASKISLAPRSTVVILDDDRSIHDVWDRRLKSLDLIKEHIDVIHFYGPQKLENWLGLHSKIDSTFLFDYELIGFENSGLDLIERHKLEGRAILTTSHFENNIIKERCQKRGVKLLPKSLAPYTPLLIEPRQECKYEAVHVEDDPYLRFLWGRRAKKNNIHLLSASSSSEVFENLEIISKSARFYIDRYLGEGGSGDSLSEILSQKGFKNLFLSTGSHAGDIPNMPWIQKIISKECPW